MRFDERKFPFAKTSILGPSPFHSSPSTPWVSFPVITHSSQVVSPRPPLSLIPSFYTSIPLPSNNFHSNTTSIPTLTPNTNTSQDSQPFLVVSLRALPLPASRTTFTIQPQYTHSMRLYYKPPFANLATTTILSSSSYSNTDPTCFTEENKST